MRNPAVRITEIDNGSFRSLLGGGTVALSLEALRLKMPFRLEIFTERPQTRI